MSVKGIIEIAVHVESFRNIDVFHQGIYYLRLTIHTHQGSQRVEAMPYDCISSHIPRSKRSQKHDPHNMIPGGIDQSSKSFFTRAFLIRYCEEEADINDIGLFRLELEKDSDFFTKDVKFEVELLFNELNGEVTPENAFEMAESKGIEFKAISKNVLHARPSKGFQEFYPLVFGDNYFSTANLIIQAATVDFRYRPHPPSVMANWGSLKKPRDLPHFLFKDSKGNPKTFVGAEETDKVHSSLCSVLVASYEKLRGILIVFMGKCLSPKEREIYGSSWIPPAHDLSHLHRKEYLDYMMESSPVHFSLEEMKEERPDISLSSISGIDEEKPRQASRFSERVASHDPRVISEQLLMELNTFAGKVFPLWYKTIELSKLSPRALCALLQENFQEKFRERWGESIVKKVYKTNDFSLAYQDNIGEAHEMQAMEIRANKFYREIEPLPIQEIGLFPSAGLHPILFEDIFVRDNLSFSQPQLAEETPEFYESCISFKYQGDIYRGIHLIVLVHGFQGNHFDMRLMKNNISLVHPEALFLCSNSNEDFTEGDIGEMGVRLAQEVMNFIAEWCPDKTLGRLSFIGHSMGGLIIRAALPYLESFSSKMHMLLTFSSPHLGYMYNSSRIIDAGIWFLKKWRKSKCLQQLSMTDSPNLRHTFMYELSNKKGIGWFRHVILVSSYQDQYAPYDSARMEVSQKANADPVRKEVYSEMAVNLLSGMTAETLHRLDINFKISEKSLDSFIGRAAHIQFLENQTIMKMIIYRYPEFFG